MSSSLRRGAVASVVGLLAASAALMLPTIGARAADPVFVALASPARALDTRAPSGTTTDGRFQATGRVTPASPVTLPLGNRFGIPTTARAAVVNLTVDAPQSDGWATVWPCGTTRPATSNINYRAGTTVANGVTVGLGTGAAICLYTDAPADLIVDVSGYFPLGGAFTPLASPQRLVDSRSGATTEDGRLAGFGPFQPGVTQALALTGRVPVLGAARALVVNITAAGSGEDGYATAWPCDRSQPSTSTVNFGAGQTVANSAMVRLSADGKLCLASSVRADFIVDVMGVLTTSDTAGFSPLTAPARFLDTRSSGSTDDGRFQAGGVVDNSKVFELDIAGRLGVPSGAIAAVLNLTATGARADGWATVFPCGSTIPATSSINFLAGTSVANGVVARLGTGGKLCIYADSPTDLIVDVSGVIQGAATATATSTTTPGATTPATTIPGSTGTIGGTIIPPILPPVIPPPLPPISLPPIVPPSLTPPLPSVPKP